MEFFTKVYHAYSSRFLQLPHNELVAFYTIHNYVLNVGTKLIISFQIRWVQYFVATKIYFI